MDTSVKETTPLRYSAAAPFREYILSYLIIYTHKLEHKAAQYKKKHVICDNSVEYYNDNMACDNVVI